MMKKVFGRTEQPSPQTKMEMFTDGNDDYTYVLPEYCADACIEYGQLVKIRENGRVVRKEKRITGISTQLYSAPSQTALFYG